MLQLTQPTSGSVVFDDTDIFALRGQALKEMRRKMQIVFQDPYASLDPRLPIGESVAEGLKIHGIGNASERVDMVMAMLKRVGLEDYHANRYPHEFSGGQRQRIGIARALTLQPEFIVLDEPVSALDVSIQAQVLNLLEDLKQQYGLTLIFIAHDLAVSRTSVTAWRLCTSASCARSHPATISTAVQHIRTQMCSSSRFRSLTPSWPLREPRSPVSHPPP